MKAIITGHRDVDTDYMRGFFAKVFAKMKRKGLKTVVSGMALGTDIVAAQMALEMGLQVHAVIPHFGHEKRRSTEQQKVYWSILAHPNTKVSWSHEGSWFEGSFFQRNRYMVNLYEEGDVVLAIMYNDQSGTGHCVREAQKQDCDITIFNPKTNVWTT